jgi:HK97 gp10 family phage protein
VFEFGELAKLDADLGVEAVRVGAKVSAVVRSSGEAAANTARQIVAVDEGDVRDSIDMRLMGDGRSTNMTAYVRAGTDHAFYLEYGTSKMAPQPYMRPALDREEPVFTAKMAALLGDVLK